MKQRRVRGSRREISKAAIIERADKAYFPCRVGSLKEIQIDAQIKKYLCRHCSPSSNCVHARCGRIVGFILLPMPQKVGTGAIHLAFLSSHTHTLSCRPRRFSSGVDIPSSTARIKHDVRSTTAWVRLGSDSERRSGPSLYSNSNLRPVCYVGTRCAFTPLGEGECK